MNHFEIEEWADFVRGLASPAVQDAMAAHLSSGCGRCRKRAEMMHAVHAAARTEANYHPPPSAVRLAEVRYAYAPPERNTLRRLVARLVQDTALEPLPAGIRAQDRLSRRALFEAGGYQLDLQLELEPNSGMVTLVGQLADRVQPETSTAEIPVWLMRRESLLHSTVCNQFGEFQLAYEPAASLFLFVPLPEAGKRLEIPLGRLTPGGARVNGLHRKRRRKSRPGS